jgi:hypothetical protein
MLVEATKLHRRLEEAHAHAHALARCAAAQGGVDADYDAGCVEGLELALVLIADLERREGIMCVTESSGAGYGG